MTVRASLAGACAALLAVNVAAAMDLDALWNFDDPAQSEQRFRDALAAATGDDAFVLRTQIARTYGLRGRCSVDSSTGRSPTSAKHSEEAALRKRPP